MAGERRDTTLDQVGRIVTGKTPPGSIPEYFGGDIPFVTPTDFDGRRLIESTGRCLTKEGANTTGRSRVPAGAVMVSCIGSDMGKAAIAGRECVTNQQINSILVDSGDDALFVYYNLSTRKAEIRAAAAGSAQPILNKSAFGQLEISLPPLPEQRAIAAVLGALDDKIEQNRRTARVLERLARAIFRAWFVDFEPVKAKAAGASGFPSMPREVFDALPTRFVDSEIGPVPEGWEVGAVGDLAALSKVQVKPQENPQEVFDHFSIPAFDAGMHPVVEPGSAIKSNKFLVAEGCVLLSKLNPRIPRVWLPPLARERRQISSTEFLVFTPISSADRHYLYCQFRERAFRDEIAQGASGTSNSHQRVRPNYLLGKRVVVPSSTIRDGFGRAADPLFELAAANHAESTKLAEMRDCLLPKLLSGEVRVRDAERLARDTA